MATSQPDLGNFSFENNIPRSILLFINLIEINPTQFNPHEL